MQLEVHAMYELTSCIKQDIRKREHFVEKPMVIMQLFTKFFMFLEDNAQHGEHTLKNQANFEDCNT